MAAPRPSRVFASRALLVEKYAALLPDSQRRYAEQRYFDDLSLAEIAAKNKVSRFAVQDGLRRAMAVMQHAEHSLHLVARQKKLESVISEIQDVALQERIRKLL